MDAELRRLLDAIEGLRDATDRLTPRRGEDATLFAIRNALGRIEAEAHSLTLRRAPSARLPEAGGAPCPEASAGSRKA